MKTKKYTLACIIISLLIIFFLAIKQEYNNKQKDLENHNKSFTIDFFYVDYCNNCENFKMIAIPKLKNKFKNMTVNYHELDDERELYDSYIQRAINFDDEEYESVPMIIIDDAFFIVGYSQGEEDELYKEILHYFNHEELGQFYVIGEYQLNKS